MKNLSEWFNSREPTEFRGLGKYYRNHPQLPWGVQESPNYIVDVPPVDPWCGAIDPPDKPHIYIVDCLRVDEIMCRDLMVIDGHGHMNNGDWTTKNKDSETDVVELVREAWGNGRQIDLILVCATWNWGSGAVAEPSDGYYEFLDRGEIAYVRASKMAVPRLRMTQKGKIIGELMDSRSFANISRLLGEK